MSPTYWESQRTWKLSQRPLVWLCVKIESWENAIDVLEHSAASRAAEKSSASPTNQNEDQYQGAAATGALRFPKNPSVLPTRRCAGLERK
jgi:hypothetical protein